MSLAGAWATRSLIHRVIDATNNVIGSAPAKHLNFPVIAIYATGAPSLLSTDYISQYAAWNTLRKFNASRTIACSIYLCVFSR